MKRINKGMADETPRRRRRSKSAKPITDLDTPDTPMVGNIGDTESANTKAIRSLIQAVLGEKVEAQKHIRESEDNSRALISTISEFLDCFVLLGYDQEGDPMIISYGPTSKDGDALRNLYLKFLPQFMHSQDDLGDPEEF
jgi:hypothetical protein